MDIENHQEFGSFPLWPLCPSPIRLANWSQFLRSHPDKRFSLYIECGFQEGFRVGFNRPSVVLKLAAKNHGSALNNPSVVSDRIKSEQALGRLMDPVHSSFTHHIHRKKFIKPIMGHHGLNMECYLEYIKVPISIPNNGDCSTITLMGILMGTLTFPIIFHV